jgi:hypothetical protein
VVSNLRPAPRKQKPPGGPGRASPSLRRPGRTTGDVPQRPCGPAKGDAQSGTLAWRPARAARSSRRHAIGVRIARGAAFCSIRRPGTGHSDGSLARSCSWIAGLRQTDRRLSRLGFLFRHSGILRIATGAENCCTCNCYDEQFHRVVLLWYVPLFMQRATADKVPKRLELTVSERLIGPRYRWPPGGGSAGRDVERPNAVGPHVAQRHQIVRSSVCHDQETNAIASDPPRRPDRWGASPRCGRPIGFARR